MPLPRHICGAVAYYNIFGRDVSMESSTKLAGGEVQQQIKLILEKAAEARTNESDGCYQAFLHGQAAGLTLALRIMFPEDGDLGDQAANLMKSVMGENACACHGHDMEEPHNK